MDDLEQKYLALVERVRGYLMPEAARAAILAEIEATFRRERAAKLGALLAQSPTEAGISNSNQQQPRSSVNNHL